MATTKYWKVWLTPNLLTKDVDNDYIAEVSTSKHTLRNEDIAQRIVAEGSEIKYDTLLSIINQHDRIIREAVCDGYARAFQYLMGQAGLQCLLVRGNAGGEGHAWNVARINDAYYQVDVTWDDPVGMDDPDYVYYGYLNLTDADMTRDHTPETEIPLPVCAATADNYFLRGGYTASALEAGQFGDAVARQVNDGARGWYQILYTGAALSEERLADFLNGNAGGRLPALSRYALNDNIIQLLFE